MGTKGYQVPESSEVVLPAIPANTPIALVQTTDPIPYAALQYMQYFDCALKNLAVAEETTVTVALVLTKEGEDPKTLASFDYTIVPVAANVAKIGNVEYPTLQAAVDAAAALVGEQVKIELLDNVTENVAISGVAGELDLGDFTLTGTISVADSTLEISNGTIEWGTVAFTVNSGTVTLAADATLTGNGTNEPVIVNDGATLNVYGRIDDLNAGGFGVKINPGATVNCYEGCYVRGNNSAFKPYPDVAGKDCYLNLYGGTFIQAETTGGNFAGVIYCSKTASTAYITIGGGTFASVGANSDAIFGNCTAVVFKDADGDVGLDVTCTATFNLDPLAGPNCKVTAEKLFKSGYKAEQSAEDGLWRIVKEYTIALDDADDMTYTVNTVFPLALPTPAESGKGEFLGWTNATQVTPITQIAAKPDPLADLEFFAAYKAVGPEWPEDDPDFPADADATVKAKFVDWATAYNVKDPAGKSDAFLMNVDPEGTIPALEITSIEVADGVATIKVAAGEKNLETGINGKLFVSATDDLAGEWVTTEVEEPDSFEDEGLTAVFKVEGAQFMKAKVDFKVETPVVKEN